MVWSLRLLYVAPQYLDATSRVASEQVVLACIQGQGRDRGARPVRCRRAQQGCTLTRVQQEERCVRGGNYQDRPDGRELERLHWRTGVKAGVEITERARGGMVEELS